MFLGTEIIVKRYTMTRLHFYIFVLRIQKALMMIGFYEQKIGTIKKKTAL